jgi:hypothetical protein
VPRLVTIAVALAVLAIPARAFAMAKPVPGGTIRVNVAVGKVRIGLPRTSVVQRIGDPVERYSDDDWGWDGRRTTFGLVFDQDRVARISIAGSGRFCIRARVCTGSRGGVGYLRRRFGSRLHFFEAEDGTRAAIVTGKLGSRKVFTIFGDLTSRRSTGKFRTVLLGDCRRGLTRPC